MSIIEGIILGIIQGFTEFLPVSSSGHLTLFQKIFGLTEPMLTFDIILHLGTLIPVFIVFRKDIISLLKNPFQKMTYMLIAGTVPTVIIALLIKDLLDTLFAGTVFLGVSFIITGFILLFADIQSGGRKTIKNASYFDAIFVGICQGIALVPGISRSGMTISGALFAGFDKDFAAKYAFLLSIPAILGALVLELKDVFTGASTLTAVGIAPTVCGFIAAAAVGYLAIRFMLMLIKKSKLKYFAYYVFLLGSLVIVDSFITKFIF